MTLTQKHRSTIYEGLRPIVGEDAAEALMAEFPAAEHDELVTKESLRAELAELRTEMHRLANRTLVVMAGTTATALVAGMGLAATIA